MISPNDLVSIALMILTAGLILGAAFGNAMGPFRRMSCRLATCAKLAAGWTVVLIGVVAAFITLFYVIDTANAQWSAGPKINEAQQIIHKFDGLSTFIIVHGLNSEAQLTMTWEGERKIIFESDSPRPEFDDVTVKVMTYHKKKHSKEFDRPIVP